MTGSGIVGGLTPEAGITVATAVSMNCFFRRITAGLGVALLGSTLLFAHEPCLRALPEYCQAGCEDLGGWIVQSFESHEEAYAYLFGLDPIERISAFVVQAPMATLLLRRERLSNPAPRPDPQSPHWKLEEYRFLLNAAADAHALGGYVYATNGGEAMYLRVWYEVCPEEHARKRPVGR